MGFEIGKLTRLNLGYVGENGTRKIVVDMNEWLRVWPDAIIAVTVCRPNESALYIAPTTIEDGILSWDVSRADVAIAGRGYAQFRASDAKTGQRYKSRVVETIIHASIEGANDDQAPDAAKGWVDQVLDAADKIMSMEAEAKTLAPGNEATAVYNDGLLTLGIPQGETGKTGTTFTPSISDDGTLSWTNDGGKDNPAPVNVKGPAGDSANAPRKEVYGRDLVYATDSFPQPLKELRIYGRTVLPRTPSPADPVMPIGPGNTGSIGVTVSGKNLFNKGAVTFADGMIIEGGSVDASQAAYSYTATYIRVLPERAYVISGDIEASDVYNRVFFYNAAKEYIGMYTPSFTGMEPAFVTPAGCAYIRFNVCADHDPNSIQLELGDEPTPFEAYTAQQATVDTYSLHGVKVGPGEGNYIDENGQEWLADYLDGMMGRKVTNIPVVVYKTADASLEVANTAEEGTAFRMKLPSRGYAIDNYAEQEGMVFCDRLPTITRDRVMNGREGVAISETHIVFCVSGVTTREAMLQWISANTLKLVYRPQYPLNKLENMEALDALEWMKLQAESPYTAIANDVNAWMTVDYIVDMTARVDRLEEGVNEILAGGVGSGVHVGSDAPTGNEDVWIDPNGEASGGGGGFHFFEVGTRYDHSVSSAVAYYKTSSYEEVKQAYDAGMVCCVRANLAALALTTVYTSTNVVAYNSGYSQSSVPDANALRFVLSPEFALTLNSDGSITINK